MTLRTTTIGDDNKYSIVFNENTAEMFAHRYDEQWRNLTGDKLVFAMLHEIETLREQVKAERERNDMIQDAQAELADRDSTGIMRATVASLMEATSEGNFIAGDKFHMVKINLDAQRTIWDRFTLKSETVIQPHNVEFVLFTLTSK